MITAPRVLALLVLLLLVYEVWTLHTPAKGDTISEVIWGLADRWSVVPFTGGIVCGHFFWPRR